MNEPDPTIDGGPPLPPRLLDRAPREHQPMSPIRQNTDLADLHRLWAELHGLHGPAAGQAGQPAPVAPAGGSGLRGKVVRQIGSVAADVAEPALRADRALIGALIRTNDALAIRCDELGARVLELEDLVREVVAVVGEDLVQVRASLQSGSSPSEHG